MIIVAPIIMFLPTISKHEKPDHSMRGALWHQLKAAGVKTEQR